MAREPVDGVPGDYVSFGKAGTGQRADKIGFFAKEGEAGDHIKKVESLFIMAGPTENNGFSVAAFMDKQITALSFTCRRSQ
ncbi:hypothetical protein [Atlantibacter sp.]|uniref:hypothetical protein n=1 Tax=Atlantibacter sp. TaxID=1903473 RepID=UPI0028AD93A4|nr:hypothetical protein [Atlantibacter sp.]